MTAQKINLAHRIRSLGHAYTQASKSSDAGSGIRAEQIAHRIVNTLPAVLHALENLPEAQAVAQSVSEDEFEWGVEADPAVGVHTFVLEATARATVEVTPTAQKPKLYKRAVGPWEEVK